MLLSSKKTPTFAIAGNPNSGKTTLFNRLTGLRQKVGNYPGVTVEKKTGFFFVGGQKIELIDLPGTYALSPRSEEERIASDVVFGKRTDVAPLDGVLCIVDGTCLERSLYLTLQLIETNVPSALLLNMADVLHRQGIEIDKAKLEEQLGIPVISVSATQGTGLKDLYHLIEKWGQTKTSPTLPKNDPPNVASRRAHAKTIAQEVVRKSVPVHSFSDRVDRYVMDRLWGPLIFGGVVLTVFQAIFSWAQPFMDAIDGVFGGVGQLASQQIKHPIISSFVADGVIAGVGSVVVFLPQILIVFFFISLLEHSGYMARAAMVMDRLFYKVGLQGKSFLPLISSYACAIPGIMATRTIENKRDRFATILIAPFMTCSARLPVYALLISAFVPNTPLIKGFLNLQAFTLLLLYIVGFVAAIGTALVLKSTVLKSSKIPFILDIPPYRMPSAKTIFLLMWDRSKIFLKRASTLILGTTIVLWFLVSFPQSNNADQIEQSYAGRIGKFIEPVIEPLGFNWKIGVGLIAAQAAREVLVSSLSTIYSIDESAHEAGTDTKLQDALKSDLTPLGAVSLMVFFVFAMQCMSTIAVARRETGGWKIPVAMFVYMNVMAYGASLVVYQVGGLLGLG